MGIIFLLTRELKAWIEYIIRDIPGGIGIFTRVHYYNLILRESSENNRFEAGIIIEFPRNVLLKPNSYFGINCKIYACELSKVKIGSNASINSNVMINARGKGRILIGNNVLIGPNVVLRSVNYNFKRKTIISYE